MVGRFVLVRGLLWHGRYGALYFGVAVLVRDRLGKAGMVGLVVVRFVLEGRVSVVYERACCVLAGVVGCVGSLYGQASWDVARQVWPGTGGEDRCGRYGQVRNWLGPASLGKVR